MHHVIYNLTLKCKALIYRMWTCQTPRFNTQHPPASRANSQPLVLRKRPSLFHLALLGLGRESKSYGLVDGRHVVHVQLLQRVCVYVHLYYVHFHACRRLHPSFLESLCGFETSCSACRPCSDAPIPLSNAHTNQLNLGRKLGISESNQKNQESRLALDVLHLHEVLHT